MRPRLRWAFPALVFTLALSHACFGAVTILSSGAAGVSSYGDIATDGSNIFFAGVNSSSQHAIFRLSVGGGLVSQLYVGPGSSINGVTVVGNDVFWIDANSGPITDTQIFRAAKSGGGPVTAIYTGANVGQPIVDGHDITTDGTFLYTSDQVQGQIHRLNTDGSGITQIGPDRYGGFFDREHSNFIAIDGGVIYVADPGRAGFSDTLPEVESIVATGGIFTNLYSDSITGFRPIGIAVGGGTIYLTDGSNTLFTMPTTGGTPTAFLTDPTFGGLGGLAFHDGTLYAIGRSAGANAPTVWAITSDGAVPEPSTMAIWSAIGLLSFLGGCRQRREGTSHTGQRV